MTSDLFTQRGIEFANRRKRLLFVDEDANDLRFLQQVFEGQGYDVLASETFESGAQCLDQGHFDFIVVSQGSHAFEGRRVLERASALDHRPPVLVLTRSLDMPCYLEAMQLGAVDYLEKPVHANDLLRIVRGHTQYDRSLPRAGSA
jgi:DNA-binding NtrC family response regulator